MTHWLTAWNQEMLANLKSHLYHHLDHYYRGFPHHQHWDHHRHNDHDHQEKLLAGRAFKKWKDHRPSFDEMHAEDLKRRPRSVFIIIMVITIMVVINIINTIIIIYSAPDIAEYNYIQWDIIVFSQCECLPKHGLRPPRHPGKHAFVLGHDRCPDKKVSPLFIPV